MIKYKRMRPVGLLLIVWLGSLLGSGCRTGSHDNEVQVRLINAVPDSGGLNISAGGRQWKDTPFRGSTGYQGMAAGTFQVNVSAQSFGTTPLTPRPLTLEKGHRYTLLALGRMTGKDSVADVKLLEDAGTGGYPAGKAGIRLIQGVPDAGAVDLVVNNIVGVKSVGYGQRSDTLLLDHGDYDLKVVSADTPDALTAPISLHLDAGHAYTLVTMGQTSPEVSLEAYPDNP